MGRAAEGVASHIHVHTATHAHVYMAWPGLGEYPPPTYVFAALAGLTWTLAARGTWSSVIRSGSYDCWRLALDGIWESRGD